MYSLNVRVPGEVSRLAEERTEMLDVAAEKLKFAMLNFYTGNDAWTDEPPTP